MREAVDFGPLLRRLRLARGISQETLAEQSGLSVQSVSSLERGARRSPYRHTVDALAEALGLDAVERASLVGAAARPRGPRTAGPSAGPSRLPAYATNFIGRDREAGELAALIDGSRLVTVCGFGGVGKTRLAVEVAAAPNRRAVTAAFVDFSALREKALVAARIGAAFKMGAAPNGNDLDALVAMLAARDVLLVLDNCEAVIDECARVVEGVLRGCPLLRVLATSREPLRIDGEIVFRLEPLDPAGAAADLFVDRIVTSRADDGRLPNRRLAAEIAGRLDGIPLAIELAAALARTRTLEDIRDSLAGDEFLHIAERRTSVEHHRTMRAAIGWSYDALSADEQTDLRFLASLPDGTSRAGAQALCARADDRNLRRLIETSLVVEDRAAGRFRLHEVTRAFAAALRTEAETDTAADRYAAYLGTRFAAAFRHGWETGVGDFLEPFVPLAAELENVRSAFRHALRCGDRALALGLCAGPDYWTVVGRVPEGSLWLERVRDACGDVDDDPRAAVLYFGLTLCAIQSGRPEETVAFATRAVELGARHELPIITGRALIIQGHIALARADAAGAARKFERAAARFAEIGVETGVSRARIFLAFAHIERGDAEAAEQIALEHERRLGERFGSLALPERCYVEILRADAARLRGDLAAAATHGRAAYDAYGGGAITSIYARAVHGLVEVLMLAGELDEATHIAAVELQNFADRGFRTEFALLLEVCAAMLVRRGRPAAAARVAAYADATLRAAKRARLRFAAALASELGEQLDACLEPAERVRAAAGAVDERPADIIAAAVPTLEVYE